MIEIHGHRGARARLPENTMNAYRYAMQIGSDAIEVDIGMSKDGVLVLHHDRDVAGKLIKDLSWEELQKFDVGSKAHPEFPEQRLSPNSRIPSLEAFLQFFDPYPNIKLNLEIKTCPFHPGETWEPIKFAQNILSLLKAYGISKERVLFQSFDPRMIMALKAEGSQHEISYLLDSWSDDVIETAQNLEIQSLSPKVSILNQERCQLLKEAGLKVYVWTANSESEWNNLKLWGADAIITDDPEKALDWRDTTN